MNNIKKILFYTDTPIAGGAEHHMLLLAKNLPKDRYKVTIACSNYKQLNNWCKQFEQEGIEVLRLKVAHKHDPRHLTQLKKIISQQQPDILHLHVWNPASCRYAFMAVTKNEPKIITTEHDPFALSGIKRSIKRSSLKKTNLVITVSQANQKLMLQLYPELKGRIETIHNGIDLEGFDKQLIHFSSQEKKKIREKLFECSSEDFVITSIATLHPRKGLKYLIKAFAELQKQSQESNTKHQTTKLIIVGEGPQKKELQKLISSLKIDNTVKLLGYQENIPRILKSSDLFVLPSIKEAFGLVLLEAMAAQLPIIATSVGGIPEIIHHMKNGILVNPENVEDLTTAIKVIIDHQAVSQKLAFIGQHDVKDFDAKKMAEKTAHLYDQALNSVKK